MFLLLEFFLKIFLKSTTILKQNFYSIQILDLHRIPFKDFNVLEDEKIREGIKEFSDWPTIPQVYVNGKFVGGADIFMQMHKDGEIHKFFDAEGIPSRFSDKFEKTEG
ncbi:unnamed protein product [Meloidogyne enterolobii]|uniref:Uncharacterized protein n=1 Tax=Meloidogyne enterolobii TaxID=390850 RepID=A0ACB1AUF3_MELEN